MTLRREIKKALQHSKDSLDHQSRKLTFIAYQLKKMCAESSSSSKCNQLVEALLVTSQTIDIAIETLSKVMEEL